MAINKNGGKPIPKPKKGDIEIIPGEDFFKNFDALSEVVFMLRFGQSAPNLHPEIKEAVQRAIEEAIGFLKEYIEKITVEPIPPGYPDGFNADITKGNIFRSFVWVDSKVGYQVRYIFKKNKKQTDELNYRLADFIQLDYVRQAVEIVTQRNRETAIEIAKLRREADELKRKLKEAERGTSKHTKMAMHTATQFFGYNKQLSVFSDEKIDAFCMATGLSITNRPDEYGVVLNQSQSRVLMGILKAFTDTNYKGDELIEKKEALKEIYNLNNVSAKTLVESDNAPYRNIDAIPVLRLTQAQVIDFSGYDLKNQRQGDKQDVVDALTFLATKQFCFYWERLKTENGKPVRDKNGEYKKEAVMEVGTLLRIKTVRDQTGLLQYYEIHASAPLLDQVNNYFLLVPNNWRDEVRQITGKRASSYTYELLFWLRVQYEQIRRYNKGGGKGRKPKPFKISKSWEEVAIALKMPETMYKANRKRASKIIQDAYSVAIKLGYLIRVENSGATDILYLNEDYYPKPGKLV